MQRLPTKRLSASSAYAPLAMSAPRFEGLTRGDIAPVLRMTRENMSSILLSAWGLEWSDETLLDAILDRSTYTEVARLGKEIVGYFTVDQKGEYVFIVSLQVRRDWQGKGLGKLMVDRIEDLVLMAGLEGVELCVQTTNETARGFYEHLDYRFVSKVRNNLLMRKAVQEGSNALPPPLLLANSF